MNAQAEAHQRSQHLEGSLAQMRRELDDTCYEKGRLMENVARLMSEISDSETARAALKEEQVCCETCAIVQVCECGVVNENVVHGR